MASTTAPRLKPGDVVGGRYRIDGVVGRGGFGAVYRATQSDTGRQVALKVLIKNLTSSEVDAKRFQREAALVQKLRHPNVVEILDFGITEEGTSYIAFELLQGTALAKLLKAQGALPLYRAAQITRDILGALAAAHAMGIIHRDVKPGNVFLVEGTDQAKVLDFGIAKAVTGAAAAATQLTETGQMIGTPQYMAPEQVRGTGVLPSTDVYAAGLLFAEMICGERMVKGASLIDIYMMHVSNNPIALPEAVTSSPVGEVIRRALAKLAEQRYATADEMLADLDRAMPGLASGAARPPASDDPNITMPFRRSGEAAAASSLPDFVAASPDGDADAHATMLMDRQVSSLLAEESSDGSLVDATLDMDGEEIARLIPSAPTGGHAVAPSAHAPMPLAASGGQPSAPTGSAQRWPAAADTQGHPPGHGWVQGYASGAHLPDSRTQKGGPGEARPSSGGRLALTLFLVAVVATVAAGLLLWAPWEDARRSIAPASEPLA